MKGIEAFVQAFFPLVILGGYGLALRDWRRLSPGELRAWRRPSWILAALALGLTALLALAAIWGLGLPKTWALFSWGLVFWLMQGLGLGALVPAGCAWARRLGRRAFGRSARRGLHLPWRWLVGALALMLAWTVLLAYLQPFKVAPGLEDKLGLESMAPAACGVFLLALLSLAPVLEECLFRHYLLYRLAWALRRGPAPLVFSIGLTSLLFALGHQGMLEPYWLKVAQTFGLGLVLGVTATRRGLPAAIALHWAFNLGMIPLAALLDHAGM